MNRQWDKGLMAMRGNDPPNRLAFFVCAAYGSAQGYLSGLRELFP